MEAAMVLREFERTFTVEEFWAVAQAPENANKRLELEDGVIVEMASSSPINTVTAGRVLHFINAFVIPRNLGYVTGADGGFKLGSKRVRQPDVGFISKASAPKLPKHFNLAPDLAVEVVSEDEDIFKKAREYLQAGTRIVWAVYSDEQIVHVIHLNADGGLTTTPYGIDAVLDGGEVLPGFQLPVREIFPA
jgi:Uma2 family endonuclease